MSEYGKTICPECGAGNGLGAPFRGVRPDADAPGMAARPADDDAEEDDAPRRPVKKPVRPPQDAVQKGLPKQKPAARPVDDDGAGPKQPVKKKMCALAKKKSRTKSRKTCATTRS